MQRYYLHADFHFDERFRLFGELGSSLETDRNGGPRPGLDEDKLDVHQGFFDLGLLRSNKENLTLRIGRQEMAFGSGNLVSTRDGRNIRLTFDGFHSIWLTGKWKIDAFAGEQTLNNPGYFDDAPNHGIGFWGVYAVVPVRKPPQGNMDLYYLGRENKNVVFDSRGTGNEQRQTVGARVWGPLGTGIITMSSRCSLGGSSRTTFSHGCLNRDGLQA
jgi:hypothetical protein